MKTTSTSSKRKPFKRRVPLLPDVLDHEMPVATFGDNHGGVQLFQLFTAVGVNDGIAIRPFPGGAPPTLTWRQAALLVGALRAMIDDQIARDCLRRPGDSGV